MKGLFDKYWKTALFTVVGAGLGLAYWRLVGCTTGSCPLTANWHTSTLFGGLIGMLAAPARKTSRKSNSDDGPGNNNLDDRSGNNNLDDGPGNPDNPA
jgi:hypothetical protein